MFSQRGKGISGTKNFTSRISRADQKKNSRYISRDQYDDLKKRFDVLAQKNKLLKAKLSSNNNLNSENFSNNSSIKSLNSRGLEETVDLFADSMNDKLSSSLIKKKQLAKNKKFTDSDIQRQLDALGKADQFIDQNKLDQAMAKLKLTENSPILAIVARSKFLIGQIMFKQGEFDLAMQMYEEVVYQYSESSIILPALKQLIICTEKLKLNKKREKYSSYYHDLFGMKQ